MTIINKEKILEEARALADEGKYDRAIREYEKILLADPNDLRIKLRIAELYTKRKQINDAIRTYREVSARYIEEGFYLKAVTVLKSVLRLNPSLIEINEELAQLYERMGLTADAVRQYQIMANALERRGDNKQLLNVRSRMVTLAPDDRTARIKLAELYQREKRMDEAIDQYEALVHILEQQGGNDLEQAELYEKILTHRPKQDDMLKHLIRIYDAHGERRKALKWLEEAKALTAQDPELLRIKGKIFTGLNQLESARAAYTTLADLCWEHGDEEGALEALAEIAVFLPEEEENVLKRVTGHDPAQVGQFQSLVRDHRKRKEEESTSSEPPQEKPAVQEKPVAKGVLPEKKVENIEPAGDGESIIALAKAYRQMGLEDDARAELEKAKALYERQGATGGETVKRRLEEIEHLLAPTPRPVLSKPTESKIKEKKKISFV